MTFESLAARVRVWAQNKNIYTQSTAFDQASKTLEEVNELLVALHRNDIDATEDAIGDTLVTLINVTKLSDLDPVRCFERAVCTIEKRQGEMVNGKFVKEAY